MDYKAIIRKFYLEAWNNRDYEALKEVMDPKYHPSWILMEEDGADLVWREIKYITSAISDWKYEIEMVNEENAVWVWYKVTGTHTGNFFGFEPTNKTFEAEGAAILYINENGQIYDRKASYSFEDIFRQLGVAPPYWELHQYVKDYKASED